MDLQRRITSLRGEFLLFALTPPRLSTTPEEAQEIADITVERLEPLDVDGLIHDIDDEADRTPEERPFPLAVSWDPIQSRISSSVYFAVARERAAGGAAPGQFGPPALTLPGLTDAQ